MHFKPIYVVAAALLIIIVVTLYTKNKSKNKQQNIQALIQKQPTKEDKYMKRLRIKIFLNLFQI